MSECANGMSEREELARAVFVADNWRARNPIEEWELALPGYKRYAYRIADAILAAGHLKGAGDE